MQDMIWLIGLILWSFLVFGIGMIIGIAIGICLGIYLGLGRMKNSAEAED
jgi:ABC-type nitrate/sulfonate/bicarbonate transport system permease component